MNSGNISKDEKLKRIKSKVKLDNLKSDFFFKRIFYCMKKNKYLNIIKYNKKLQKRLHLSINDYKDYFQIYSPIELELTIIKDKYGKFINISDNNLEHCHIYFDNAKIELKRKNRNYLKKKEKVKTIRIILDYQIKSFKNLFESCKALVQ